MISNIFSKNKLFFTAIFLIATILRFACINKIDGLWYDELVMYNQAVQQNLKDVIITALSQDVHLPLYQILLHYWAKIFSFSDYSLRSFSAICGILTVIISFFIGKQLKSAHTGLVIMVIFAINSFLIYYSQEVRMYELLTFFVSLNILALTKLPQKNWYIIWILSSTALILTYTISFLYIITQIICYALYKKNQIDKNFVLSCITLVILNTPVIIYLFLFREKFARFITGFYSDWSSLFVSLQNFFTPKLIGLGNNPPHYFGQFLTTFSISDFLFVLIPICIAIYLIIYSILRNKIAKYLLIMSILFLFVEVIAFVFTDFKILSRYLILILPNFLIIIGLSVDKSKINAILLTIFITINLGYLLFSQNASYKQPRTGFLPLVNLLITQHVNDNDIIIVWNRKEILSKYLNKKVLVLSILKDFAYKSEYIINLEPELNKTNENGKKELLREYFKSGVVPDNTLLITNYMINNLKKGQKVIITSFDFFNNIDYKNFLNIVNNDKEYKNITYNNLITAKSLLDLRFICGKNLIYKGAFIQAPFIVYVYEK